MEKEGKQRKRRKKIGKADGKTGKRREIGWERGNKREKKIKGNREEGKYRQKEGKKGGKEGKKGERVKI